LVDNQLIEQVDDKWVLTENGKSKGGIVMNHSRVGFYIAWDEKKDRTRKIC
jgi:hypothetical protein